jgi:CHAT domain-containing protein
MKKRESAYSQNFYLSAALLGSIFVTFSCKEKQLDNDVDPQSKQRAERAKLVKPIQVTVGNDANFAPDFNEQNKSILFTSTINGNQDLAIKSLATGQTSRVTNHPADDYAPIISGDGKLIAFLTRRQDAAGDLAVAPAADAWDGKNIETEIKVANITDTEELSATWTPDSQSIVVPARSAKNSVPHLYLYDAKTLERKEIPGAVGEEPSISSDGHELLYVRGGHIYSNSLGGGQETDVTKKWGGIWTRPYFIANSKNFVAIRYLHDTNKDSKVDGLDHGTVWFVNRNPKLQATQLTSAQYNAYMPKAIGNTLYVTLQTKLSLEVFKLPLKGQYSDGLKNDDENTYFPFINDPYDRYFILSSMNNGSDRSQSALRKLDFAVQSFPSQDCAIAVSDFAEDLTGNASTHFIQSLNNYCKILPDLDSARSGKLNKTALQRILDVDNTFKQVQRHLPVNIQEFTLVLRSRLLIAAGKESEIEVLLSKLEHSSNARLKAASAILRAEAALRMKQTEIAKKRYKDFLNGKFNLPDYDQAAVSGLVQIMKLSLTDSEALNQFRQDLAKTPKIPVAAHEEFIQTFLAKGKSNIALQEYRQSLTDHCQSNPLESFDMARRYIDLYLSQSKLQKQNATSQLENEVDDVLSQFATCVKDNPYNYNDAMSIHANALVRQGANLQKYREFGAALKLFKKATQIDRNNIAAWRGLIDTSFAKKSLNEINQNFNEWSLKYPKAFWLAYAKAYAATYKIDEAKEASDKLDAIESGIEQMTIARDLDPNNMYPYQTLGWLYMQKGHWTDRYRTSGGFKATANALYSKVKGLFKKAEANPVELAVDYFLAALNLAEDNSIESANLYQNLGEAYYELDNHQKALVYFSSRVKLAQTQPFSDKTAEAGVLTLAGKSAYQIDEFDFAAKLQQAALESWQSLGQEDQITRAYEGLALSLRENKKFDDAIIIYEKLQSRYEAKKSTASVKRTLSNIGYCYFEKGLYTKSISIFQDALKLQNSEGAMSGADTGATKIAIGASTSASKGFDDYAMESMGLTFIARSYEKLGQSDRAIASFRKKISFLEDLIKKKKGGSELDLKTEISITRNNIAVLYINSGRLEDAMAELKVAYLESAKLNEQDGYSSDQLIHLLLWSKTAIKSLLLTPQKPNSWNELRDTVAQLHDKTLAALKKEMEDSRDVEKSKQRPLSPPLARLLTKLASMHMVLKYDLVTQDSKNSDPASAQLSAAAVEQLNVLMKDIDTIAAPLTGDSGNWRELELANLASALNYKPSGTGVISSKLRTERRNRFLIRKNTAPQNSDPEKADSPRQDAISDLLLAIKSMIDDENYSHNIFAEDQIFFDFINLMQIEASQTATNPSPVMMFATIMSSIYVNGLNGPQQKNESPEGQKAPLSQSKTDSAAVKKQDLPTVTAPRIEPHEVYITSINAKDNWVSSVLTSEPGPALSLKTPTELVASLAPKYKRAYLTCYGAHCSDMYDKLQSKFGLVSVFANLDILAKAIAKRRIATSIVRTISTADPGSFGKPSGQIDLAELTVTDESPKNFDLLNTNTILIPAPLLLSAERPWLGEIRFDEQRALSLQAFSQMKPIGGTYAFLQHPQGQMRNFNLYNMISVLMDKLDVQSTFLLPPEVYKSPASFSPILNINPVPTEKWQFPSAVVIGLGPLAKEDGIKLAQDRLEETLAAADAASTNGDSRSSQVLYEEALTYAELVDRVDVSETLTNKLVKIHYKLRNFNRALYFQDKKIEKSPTTASLYVQAATMANYSEQFSRAKKYLDEAESLFKKADDNVNLSMVFYYRALIAESELDYQASLTLYEQSRQYSFKAGKKSDAAQKLIFMGNIYLEKINDITTALEHFDRAFKEFQDAQDTSKLVNIQIDRANALLTLGETRWAINVVQNRILNQVTPDSDLILWVRAKKLEARAYFTSGLFQESQAAMEQMDAQVEKISDPLQKAGFMIDLKNQSAMNLEKVGKHADATELFNQGVAIAKKFNLKAKESMLYNNLGFWTREQGNYPVSIQFFEKALRIDKDLKSEADQAYDKRNLAMTLVLTGDLTQAKALASESAATSAKLKLAYNDAYSQFTLAEIAVKENKLDDALSLFENAKNTAKKSFLQDFEWKAYSALAGVRIKKGQIAEAITDLKSAVSIIEKLRAGLTGASSKTGFASDRGIQDVYVMLVKALMAQGQIQEGWQFSERSRARAFIDALGSKAGQFADPQLNQALDEERKLRSDVELAERKLALAPPSAADLAQIQSKLTIARSTYQAKFNVITEKWPQMAPMLQVGKLEADVVTKRLTPKRALLEYMILDDSIAYWLLTPGNFDGGILKVNPAYLREKVNSYRELMQNFATVEATSKDLAKAILDEPLAKLNQTQPATTSLVIVPHLDLHYLPFSSLPFKDGHVLDQYAVTYLESSEMLKFLHEKPVQAQNKVAAFANPDRGPNMNLPFAEREVKSIQRTFSKMTAHFGKDATIDAFKKAVGTAEILHFAGHGEFDGINPSASRLLFSGHDDLKVSDILTIDIQSKLVMLSACETGLGSISAGDEIVGFNRSLFFAGSTSVISSLWRVSDVASSVMVKRFYRNLADGQDYEESLRQSQLLVKKYYKHPAYWSPFKLSGLGR